MTQFTLTISPDYVKDWTQEDAVREFIQNALDQESDENLASIKASTGCIIIDNSASILERSTLLLGGGTKSNDETKIGGFGEGYKIALLVLTRLGFTVHIANYGLGELWTPEISHSDEYGTDVLKINCRPIQHGADIQRGVSVIITKPGVLFSDILSHIHLKEREYDVVAEHSGYGQVLDHDSEAGRIYIGGLYITTTDQLHYGYNFNPGILSVGRDRNITDTFNIRYYAGKYLFRNTKSDYIEEVFEGIEKNLDDFEYVDKQSIPSGVTELAKTKYANKQVISKESDKQTLTEHGINVSNPVVVHSAIKEVIWTQGVGKPVIKCKSAKELLGEFLQIEKANLTADQYDKLNHIYSRD